MNGAENEAEFAEYRLERSAAVSGSQKSGRSGAERGAVGRGAGMDWRSQKSDLMWSGKTFRSALLSAHMVYILYR